MPPRHASSFATMAERRAWLDSAPATHVNHRPKNWPAAKWLIAAKDVRRLDGLKLWRHLNESPQLCANDNDPRWPDGRKIATQVDSEMDTYSAKQLVYAYNNGMTRWVGNRLVKVWNGHTWVNPDESFTVPKAANDPKVDAVHYHADVQPFEAQDEQAKSMDVDRLRPFLGVESCAVLDMAAGDATIQEIGEVYGAMSSRDARRKGGERVITAIDALLAATSMSNP